MADKLGVGFLETSARKSKNVEQAFMSMTREVITNYQNKNKSNSLGRNINSSTLNLNSIPVIPDKTNCICSLI